MPRGGDQQAPPSPTAIVVFGAPVTADGRPTPTLRRRLDAALRAADAYPDAVLVLTGGPVATPIPEAAVMRRILIASGVAADRIVLEDRALTTLENARYVAHLLRTERTTPGIVIVSSKYHVLRCRFCLRVSGLRVIATFVPPDERQTMGVRAWRRAVMREVIAFPINALRALGPRPRSPAA